MPCNVTNNSAMNIDELSPLIDDLASHIQDQMKFKSMPAITMQDDEENAKSALGRTAQYDPQSKVITVYVSKRHPKDIMRSIAHEFIHHAQNERGDFDNLGAVGEGYAQSDQHLRKMEKEAYLKGNMCFRDWEDGYKRNMMESIHRQNKLSRRYDTMKIHKWKNNELNRLLMEKFNLGEGNYNRSEEEKDEDAVNEDLGQGEAELKAQIKQAEDEGDNKKAEELRKQLQQMGGYMQENAEPDKKEEKEEDEQLYRKDKNGKIVPVTKAYAAGQKTGKKIKDFLGLEEGELPPGLKAYQDKKKGDSDDDEEEEETLKTGDDPSGRGKEKGKQMAQDAGKKTNESNESYRRRVRDLMEEILKLK